MKPDKRPSPPRPWALVLAGVTSLAVNTAFATPQDIPVPLSLTAVESLLVAAGWSYAIGESQELHVLFAGEGQPDRQVILIIEHTRDGHPWGVTFLHPVGTVDGLEARKRLMDLLRSANDFNATRMFGKVVLSPQEDGSWAIRYLHAFDFSAGIAPSSFLDPLMLLMGEMEDLYDRFFVALPSESP